LLSVDSRGVSIHYFAPLMSQPILEIDKVEGEKIENVETGALKL
jgi:hypothetical protein